MGSEPELPENKEQSEKIVSSKSNWLKIMSKFVIWTVIIVLGLWIGWWLISTIVGLLIGVVSAIVSWLISAFWFVVIVWIVYATTLSPKARRKSNQKNKEWERDQKRRLGADESQQWWWWMH
ncbi:hypothetical protein KBX31_04260 [Liquorilactobacillus satsumensis]|uniref:hypothetical protein n=1 Tax=Liquorilactobacillus TaxID=2767888 RepID=UPI0021C2C904|nr:hypothetical protein [Liquorilactobacillus satsumensis]MCP9312513.1 hypothetical protein [Liquorilactobacillus satsumensis]MCP9359803.1 hypothetical protein [Liquorilactobacillus satsumensis]